MLCSMPSSIDSYADTVLSKYDVVYIQYNIEQPNTDDGTQWYKDWAFERDFSVKKCTY